MYASNYPKICIGIIFSIYYLTILFTDLMVDDGAAPIKLLSASNHFADEMLFRVMTAANVKTHFLAVNEKCKEIRYYIIS